MKNYVTRFMDFESSGDVDANRFAAGAAMFLPPDSVVQVSPAPRGIVERLQASLKRAADEKARRHLLKLLEAVE